jgi:Ctr copper transporter family
MRKAMVLSTASTRTFSASQDGESHSDSMAIGCGVSSSIGSARHGITRINRRRLEMVADASVCNNVTNFFCWMSCLDIPEASKAVGYITEGNSLYCLDPATLAKSGNRVSSAQEKCNSADGIVGGAHNDACIGSWQPTAPGVPFQEVKLADPSALVADTAFCYGGTSMYMDGFHWTDPTCVIYLFPTWILNSARSLVGACVGTILFAIALEAVIWKRRSVIPAFPAGWKRLGVSTLFYGVQLTMGYLLMLVVMIYSGPLFFSVIVGLMGGHALFNAGGIKPHKRKSSDEYIQREQDTDKNDNSSDGLERSDSRGLQASEGITPCCQNTV